jgi:hypothetical protein
MARPYDPLGKLYFPPEASTELIIRSLRWMDDLDGHPLSCRTERGMHSAHATGSKSSHDAVRTYTARVAMLHRPTGGVSSQQGSHGEGPPACLRR